MSRVFCDLHSCSRSSSSKMASSETSSLSSNPSIDEALWNPNLMRDLSTRYNVQRMISGNLQNIKRYFPCRSQRKDRCKFVVTGTVIKCVGGVVLPDFSQYCSLLTHPSVLLGHHLPITAANLFPLKQRSSSVSPIPQKVQPGASILTHRSPFFFPSNLFWRPLNYSKRQWIVSL